MIYVVVRMVFLYHTNGSINLFSISRKQFGNIRNLQSFLFKQEILLYLKELNIVVYRC